MARLELLEKELNRKVLISTKNIMKTLENRKIARRVILAGMCFSLCGAAAFAADKNYTHDYDRDRGGEEISEKSSSPQQFVWSASVAGLKEVRLGQMADQRSSNADVKHFAQMMVADHGTANQELIKIAQSKGLAFPESDMFDAEHLSRNVKESVKTSDEAIEVTSTPTTPKRLDSLPTIVDDNIFNRDLVATRAGSSTVTYRIKGNKAAREIQRLDALSGHQFDREYAEEMVRDHAAAVRKFEWASENLSDADLRAFASKTLPTLRDHYAKAQKLALDLNATSDAGSVQREVVVDEE